MKRAWPRLCAAFLVAVVLACVGAACGGGSGSPTPTTPQSPTITSVSVTGTTALTAGQTNQFTATATMSNGSTQSCSSSAVWQSSNTSVATVASGGMVTAVAAGEADIRATCQGVTGTSHVAVSAPAATITSVTVSGSSSLTVGQTSQLTATANLSNGANQSCTTTATWQSSNTSVATVSSAGMVTAIAAGDADIRANCQGTTGALKVTVATAVFTLSGTVKDDAGAAVSGATVEVTDGANTGKSTTSDSAGAYRLTGLIAGTFTLKASKTNYDTTTQSVTLSHDATTDVTLRRAVTATYTVSGTVREDTGIVLSGATVEAMSGATAGRWVNTGSDGAYSLAGIAGGSCDVRAGKSGYDYSTKSVNLTSNTTLDFTLKKSATSGCGPTTASCGAATAKCNDSTYSCSQNRSGTCSSHGGVACWICPGVLCSGLRAK